MAIITVVKRDGSRVPLALEKWQAQIAKVCQGIADVSQSMIEINIFLKVLESFLKHAATLLIIAVIINLS